MRPALDHDVSMATKSDVQPVIDPARFARLLLYGSPATRHELAGRLLSSENDPLIDMLIATVRSDERLDLRTRCLEVLGLVAAADVGRGNRIVDALVDCSESS